MNLSLLRREMGFAYTIFRKRPYQLLLQVTNRCNMDCSFCTFPHNAARPHEEITAAECRRLAAEMSALGHFLVSVEGGEPFVRPDLPEIIRAFSREHLPVLYTNGWYATAENVRELFDAGVTQVGVSVDFPDVRHDKKRGLDGALERALKAVELFRDAAPHGGKQVHIMTVLTRENVGDMEELLQMSAARRVGHVVTLLSDHGARRGKGRDAMPDAPVSKELLELWRKHPHWRFWSEYLERMDDFLGGKSMPACGAGLQSFNVDHVGNVSVCIEKLDRPVGNIRNEPLKRLHEKLVGARDQVENCQECWTACRGFAQLAADGGTLRGWSEMALRMRSQ
jgi:MoaA/NifB/PqqE/SkfB family radical SAM enzyme